MWPLASYFHAFFHLLTIWCNLQRSKVAARAFSLRINCSSARAGWMLCLAVRPKKQEKFSIRKPMGSWGWATLKCLLSIRSTPSSLPLSAPETVYTQSSGHSPSNHPTFQRDLRCQQLLCCCFWLVSSARNLAVTTAA